MSENNILLKAVDICKDYYDGPKVLHILRGISLEIYKGKSISIIGTSGSGKSTFLHLLGALDRPTKGEIIFENKKYNNLSDNNLAEIRNRKIGIIYQFHHLLPEFSALENVMIPALIQNTGNKKEIKARAEQILSEVGLGERFGHRPAKLSGGEQQRVALARALMNDPDLILADEPTGDLDPETAQAMIDIIWQKIVERNKSLVIVTHDHAIASRADFRYKLDKGTITKYTF